MSVKIWIEASTEEVCMYFRFTLKLQTVFGITLKGFRHWNNGGVRI